MLSYYLLFEICLFALLTTKSWLWGSVFINYFYKRIQRTFNLIQVISTCEGGSLISNNILISIQITVTVFIQINSPIKTRNSPSRYLLVQSQQCKHQNSVWNLFKVYNKDTRTTSLTLFIDVILMSLLLTLNRFHTLLW